MAYSHILVLHTDTGSVNKTKYVIDIVQALRETGYKVYLLTTNSSIKYINDVPFKLILSWFPRSIFGYHQDYLFTIRSLLLAIYACWNPPDENIKSTSSSLVICDGSALSIPVLKYFGFHVSFINHMISHRRLTTHANDVFLTPLDTKCLQQADEVIVPSNECHYHLECLLLKNLLVIPPCVEESIKSISPGTDFQIPDLHKFQHIFTVFGEYSKPKNMYMVLYAFIDLRQMLTCALYNNTRLVFVGRCETDFEQKEFNKFNSIIMAQDIGISDKIFIYDTNDMKTIKSFLHNSIALIDTNEESLYDVLLVKAQDMGKPVICFESGFNREVVLNEETGIFVAKHVHSLRNCMHRFICGRHWAEGMGLEAKRNIRELYAMCMFRENVNYLASSCKIVKYNSFLPIDSYESFHWNRADSLAHYDHKTCED